jgi:hypothetical protein
MAISRWLRMRNITDWLHGAEPFLRSRQLLSYSRISQHFMESEGSLPCSQEPSTGPYPEPDQSTPWSLRSVLTLSTHPRLGLPSGLFWFSHQYSVYIPLFPHTCYMPCPSHPPWFVYTQTTTKLSSSCRIRCSYDCDCLRVCNAM